MSVHRIVPGLHHISGFANTYLLEGPEGLTLIDTGLENREKTVLGAIAAMGRAPSDLRNIVITHAHLDHIGSVGALKAATGAEVWVHTRDADIVEGGGPFRPFKTAPRPLFRLAIKLFDVSRKRVKPAQVDHRVEDGDLLPLAGGLRAIHLPGHCAGQIALLWEPRRVIFTGDVCMNILGLGPPLAYEDEAQGEASLKKLGRLDYDIACFGHGKPIVGDAAAKVRRAFS